MSDQRFTIRALEAKLQKIKDVKQMRKARSVKNISLSSYTILNRRLLVK